MTEKKTKFATQIIQEREHKPPPPFLTAYGPKRKVSIQFDPAEGKTKQEFRDESDINVIMKRYAATGVIEFLEKRSPQYADVTGRDYQAAMELLADARSAFEELPAALRERFQNDPAELLDFIHDDDNWEEAAALGLLKPEAVAALEAAKAQAAAEAVLSKPRAEATRTESAEATAEAKKSAPRNSQDKPDTSS